MIYPKFLEKESTIGITAPSAGVGEKLESFDKSLEQLKKHFNNIIETNNVRNKGIVSSDEITRAKELMELATNKKIELVLLATGGDFMMEILPYINFEEIKNNPKWYQGYSDITNILYPVTTICDIATIYSGNAGSFDMEPLHESLLNNIEILKGNLIPQNSFEYYESTKQDTSDGYALDTKVNIKCDKNININGRIIGGCLDVLKNIVGTKYDNTKNFIEKYKEDGIIWYFDIFSLSSEETLRTLWQLDQAGWFKYSKCFIFGRVKFPNTFMDLSYSDVYKKVLNDKIIITDADVGHVKPTITIINGALTNVKYEDGKLCLKHEIEQDNTLK